MSTEFCISQLKSRKSADKALRNVIIKAKGYSDLDALVKDWTGGNEFAAIKTSIEARATAPPILLPATDDDGSVSSPPQASQLLSTKSYDVPRHTGAGRCRMSSQIQHRKGETRQEEQRCISAT